MIKIITLNQLYNIKNTCSHFYFMRKRLLVNKVNKITNTNLIHTITNYIHIGHLVVT